MKKACIFFFFASLVMASCRTRTSMPISGEIDNGDDEIKKGALVFDKHCSKCHPGGEKGLGPSLVNNPLPGFAMRMQIRHGFGTMPSFKKSEISKEELDQVIDYIKLAHKMAK